MKILLILLIINFIISCIDWVFLWLITKCVKQRLGWYKEFDSSLMNNATFTSSLFRYGIIAACPVINVLFAIVFVTSFDECVDGSYNKLKGYIKDEN